LGADERKEKLIEEIDGTQLADLAAYPIARHILHPGKASPAYEIVSKKFYKGKGWVRGLKVFP